MESSSSNTARVIQQTLLASIIYEVLHLGQLSLIMIHLPKNEAGFYALIICLGGITSKFIDAGAGISMPRFLNVPSIKHSIINILLTQTLVALPFIVTGTFLISKTPLGYIPIILLIGYCEAISNATRHAVYSTLQSTSLMICEVTIKACKLLSLFLLFSLDSKPPLTTSIILMHFTFFLIANTGAIARLAWQSCLQNRYESATWQQHKIVLKQRLQIFSTKFFKDLLSTYALTPIFAYTCGIEHTWLFYFCSAIMAGLQTTIKMAIGYTAAGTFIQLPKTSDSKNILRLNKALFALIGGSLGIVSGGYTMIKKLLLLTPGEIQAANYIICFAFLTFVDLSTIVYEQYLLANGKYNTYHIIRLFEYTATAASIVLLAQTLDIQAITSILISIKIIIHIFLRSYALTHSRRRSTPILPSFPHPRFPHPPHSPPTVNTPKPQSSQAPTQGGELGCGVLGAAGSHKLSDADFY